MVSEPSRAWLVVNPIVRGWMQYYGAFYRSALYQPFLRINAYLVRWVRKKYKAMRAGRKAIECWRDRRTVSPHVRGLDMDSLGFVRLVTRTTRAR
jgi:hypothetical protein